VKVLFDTSVLVPAIVTSHPQHNICWRWLEEARTDQFQGVVSTHTMAELYSVLTRLPYRPVISPAIAQRQIRENLQNFERVGLDPTDYDAAIDRMTALNLPGGGIFDALIAQAAVKAGVDLLLTLNAKHFVRLGEEIKAIVRVPQ
jgi:predicted nucleic acid-binding protein